MLITGNILMFEELITDPRLIHLQNNFENLDEGEMRFTSRFIESSGFASIRR